MLNDVEQNQNSTHRSNHCSNHNSHHNKTEDWQPSCTKEALEARAKLLEKIRLFFKERQVLEVETPLLSAHAATDLHIQAIPVRYATDYSNDHAILHPASDSAIDSAIDHAITIKRNDHQNHKYYYLQTSPEFAMKRLLAAGSGSIYQLCKAFRHSERGHRHNPEFSMLEWYRVGFDHHQLMDEMDAFLQEIISAKPARRFSYQALFLDNLNIEPHGASLEDLKKLALQQGIHIAEAETKDLSKDDWLDLLMTHCIEPQLKDGTLTPVMIYDYPATQAALAKVRQVEGTNGTTNGKTGPKAIKVAERFEVYIEGIELANGYHELSDGDVQLQRFKEDNEKRVKRNLPKMEPDLRLVQALKAGFPSCAGVALGIDRLLMLAKHYKSIDEVLSFTIERA